MRRVLGGHGEGVDLLFCSRGSVCTRGSCVKILRIESE